VQIATSEQKVSKLRGEGQMLRFIRHRFNMDRILLVDDNPLRAAVRKSSLEGGSPEVVRAHDPGEALCLVQIPEFAESLSLVITGHVLSGISGPEFVAEVRSRIPGVPVLVLGADSNAENEYSRIPGVRVAETTSPDTLRTLVQEMTSVGERQAG
jgi:CheY-like chemotaxis protein